MTNGEYARYKAQIMDGHAAKLAIARTKKAKAAADEWRNARLAELEAEVAAQS